VFKRLIQCQSAELPVAYQVNFQSVAYGLQVNFEPQSHGDDIH